jgi:hypothetical protein
VAFAKRRYDEIPAYAVTRHLKPLQLVFRQHKNT